MSNEGEGTTRALDEESFRQALMPVLHWLHPTDEESCAALEAAPLSDGELFSVVESSTSAYLREPTENGKYFKLNSAFGSKYIPTALYIKMLHCLCKGYGEPSTAWLHNQWPKCRPPF